MSVHAGGTRAAREQGAAAEASHQPQISLRLINASSLKLAFLDGASAKYDGGDEN